MEQPLADLVERPESERPVECDSPWFRVGEDADAANLVPLRQGQEQHTPHQRGADSQPLGPTVHAEAREPQGGEGVSGQSST